MFSVAFCTLGCKVNQYETDAMQEKFVRAGYEIRPFTETADVYIINTCTVTNIADRKSRQMLHRARKRNPSAIVVAVGCYVETAPQILNDDGTIDIMIGNDKKSKIVEIVEEAFKKKKASLPDDASDVAAGEAELLNGEKLPGDASDMTAGKAETEKEEILPGDVSVVKAGKTGLVNKEESAENDSGSFSMLTASGRGERTRAYIKIQDGCNQFCSYCIIPYARGRVRSRSMEDIEEEIRTLALSGYKEVVITGIHISSYGIDFNKHKEKHSFEVSQKPAEEKNFGPAYSQEHVEEDYGPFAGDALIELTERIAGIEGIERIRLGSLEPRIITEAFLRRLSALPQICPQFHLSLQSGCDETLKRMNRHYSGQLYLESCALIRKYFDRPAITTDVIVGFPGETQEEFDITKQFIREVHFADMHIFKYSRRSGTRAAKMPCQIDPIVQALRSDELILKAESMRDEYIEECSDQVMEVLIEEESEIEGRKYMTGYSKNYIRCAFENMQLMPGSIVNGTVNGKLTKDILFCKE